MLTFQLVLCSAFVVSSWAGISNDQIKLKIFESVTRDFERNVYESLERTKNFFAQDGMQYIVDGEATAAGFIPFVRQLASSVPVLRSILSYESHWKRAFTKMIANETQRDHAAVDIRQMESKMQRIHDKILLLSPNTNLDHEKRNEIASIIHTGLDNMINVFAHSESLFKKYPMMGAPPLIELALLIATFNPLAKALIPIAAKNPQLTCKVRDVLIEYRQLTVNARLQKIRNGESIQDHGESFQAALSRAKAIPYNQYGYSNSNPGISMCERGCNKPTSQTIIEQFFWGVCVVDEFGSDIYRDIHPKRDCSEEYALLVRHRVEQMFPAELLNSLCTDEKQSKPSGKFPSLQMYENKFR